MRHLRVYLRKSILFADYDDADLYNLLGELNYRISTFSDGQTVAVEGAPCSHLGIILTGEAQVQKIHQAGHLLTVDRLRPGSVFGEAVIFSQRRKYPATIVASDRDTAIMFIRNREIVRLCSTEPQFIRIFLSVLSNKILMLNRKIESLSHRSIRHRVIGFLLEEYRRQKTTRLTLSLTRREMAEQLGIPRPSLSRELVNMRDEGLIDFNRNSVQLNCPEALEDSLFG
ncbi:MAG: Crp/Fnr family transcriptional regulator [Bacillota bacterium]